MKTITPEREAEIRRAHAAYAADEESQVRDGFRAVEDLLALLDAERTAVDAVLLRWEAILQRVTTFRACAREIRLARGDRDG